MYHYTISGLTVHSDVELRSALQAEGDAPIDVYIRRGVLAPAKSGPCGDVYSFDIAEVGSFVIRQGREILYQPAIGIGIQELSIYLVGTCFAALLQQRGHLVLHASAVSVHGRAMLFCGESGAGKSTMAAMLNQRGYPLVNDDVCNLIQNVESNFTVSPDGRMLKLWSSTLDHLGQEGQGVPIRQGFDKFYTAPAYSERHERTVGAIYVLELAPKGEPPGLHRVGAGPAMIALHRNVYRRELVEAMGQQTAYFQATASLCRQHPVYRLSRPKDFAQADAVLDLLEASWNDIGWGSSG